MLAVRKGFLAFGRGTLTFLRPGNRKILAYLRSSATRSCCAWRTSRAPRSRSSSTFRSSRAACPIELLGPHAVPADRRSSLPSDADRAWLPLVPARVRGRPAGMARGARAARRPAGARAVRRLGEPVPRSRRAVADRASRKSSARSSSAKYCPRSSRTRRWFAGKGRGAARRADRLRRVEARPRVVARCADPGRIGRRRDADLFPSAVARLGRSRRRDAAQRSARSPSPRPGNTPRSASWPMLSATRPSVGHWLPRSGTAPSLDGARDDSLLPTRAFDAWRVRTSRSCAVRHPARKAATRSSYSATGCSSRLSADPRGA